MNILYLILSWLFGFSAQENTQIQNEQYKTGIVANTQQNPSATMRTDGNPERKLGNVGPIIVIEDTHFKKDNE
ncbi:MAG: hypothetical protein K1X92_16990 [Bacteroidia bacterium]|nr:hypothetical protein [Bacteroidia bacterium]